jgi:hypothetical protein
LLILLTFIVTWAIGLSPPLLLRYVLHKRPFGKEPAIATVIGLFIFNIAVVLLLSISFGSGGWPSPVWGAVAVVSYFILRQSPAKADGDSISQPMQKGQTQVPEQAPIDPSRTDQSNTPASDNHPVTQHFEDGPGDDPQIRAYKNAYVAPSERAQAGLPKAEEDVLLRDTSIEDETVGRHGNEGELEGSYENAWTKIKYQKSAHSAWNRLAGMPRQQKRAFLRELEKDPGADATIVAEAVIVAYRRPFDTDEINDAYEKIWKYGKRARDEFARVVGVLGNEADTDSIVDQIAADFAEETENGPADAAVDFGAAVNIRQPCGD